MATTSRLSTRMEHSAFLSILSTEGKCINYFLTQSTRTNVPARQWGIELAFNVRFRQNHDCTLLFLSSSLFAKPIIQRSLNKVIINKEVINKCQKYVNNEIAEVQFVLHSKTCVDHAILCS